MPPLRDIVIGFAFYIGLRGPGSIPIQSSHLFIYCSYSLEPVGYGRYRKEISINKSSKKICESRRANQTMEILHTPAPIHPCSVIQIKSYVVAVGVAFSVGRSRNVFVCAIVVLRLYGVRHRCVVLGSSRACQLSSGHGGGGVCSGTVGYRAPIPKSGDDRAGPVGCPMISLAVGASQNGVRAPLPTRGGA